MSIPFPETPFFSGNYAPVTFEADAPDLPLRGELPKDLAGTLYRNGPNPQFAPRDPNHHWFVGDGMIHAFHIADGRVSYRNRWVRTPKWEVEHAARKALFGSWGNPTTTDPSVLAKDGGVANTNIVWHAGKLFALEEGHRPFALDPESLGRARLLRFRRRFQGRAVHRASQDRSRNRRDDLLRLLRRGTFFAGRSAYGVIDQTASSRATINSTRRTRAWSTTSW